MFKRAWWLAAGSVILVATLAAFQMKWRVYTSMEPYDDIPLPPDHQAQTDWVFARLMYPQNPDSPRRGGDSGAVTATGARVGPVGPRITRAPIGTSPQPCGG